MWVESHGPLQIDPNKTSAHSDGPSPIINFMELLWASNSTPSQINQRVCNLVFRNQLNCVYRFFVYAYVVAMT